MLVVPFGRQRMLGVVVGLVDESEVPPERLVEPLTLLDPEVPAELVKLGLWVGREYCSTPARGLGLVLPPGTGTRGLRARAARELWARPTERGRTALAGAERLGDRQRAALERLSAAPEDGLASRELAAAGIGSDTLRRLERRGLVELVEVERRRRPTAGAVGAPPVEV